MDIAFAPGVLAPLGSRVPTWLKVVLTSVAVIDDIVAVIIIAPFHTEEVTLVPLALAAGGLAVLIVLNRAGVRSLWPYLLLGVLVWRRCSIRACMPPWRASLSR